MLVVEGLDYEDGNLPLF